VGGAWEVSGWGRPGKPSLPLFQKEAPLNKGPLSDKEENERISIL